jgi:molybdate transport system regulatory protein
VTSQPDEIQALEMVNAELRLAGGLTERLFDLLAAVDSTGSISRAARKVGMSYKGAWDMLERANNLSRLPLIATEIGGRRGGGARLTPFGKKLLDLFLWMREEHRRFLGGLNAALLEDPELRVFFRRWVIKASARNQLSGRIAAIRSGDVEAEVVLEIKGSNRIVASITRKSAESLDLAPGMDVVALVNAHQVVVVKDLGGYRLSARNQLSGIVERIQKGAVNTELVMYLPGGDAIAAVITNASLAGMELREGDSATAVFKAGAVILGVAEG